MNRLVNRGMDKWLEGLVCAFFLSAILNPIWMIRSYDVTCPRPRLHQVRGKRKSLRETDLAYLQRFESDLSFWREIILIHHMLC